MYTVVMLVSYNNTNSTKMPKSNGSSGNQPPSSSTLYSTVSKRDRIIFVVPTNKKKSVQCFYWHMSQTRT